MSGLRRQLDRAASLYGLFIAIVVAVSFLGLYTPILWLPLYLLFNVACVPALLIFLHEFARSRRPARLLAYLAVVATTVLFHPFVQPVYLESFDEKLNREMVHRATNAGVIGLTEREVVELFGRPFARTIRKRASAERGSDAHRMATDRYAVLEWYPLPFYWLGSHFQAEVVDGRVLHFEGSDD